MSPTASPPLTPADFVVVMVTVPDEETSSRLAHALVGEQLAACVNVLPGVRSVYVWEGEICNEGELLCLIKTRRELFPSVRDRVVDLHPYQVPEIVALPLVEGSEPYLTWLRENTRPSTRIIDLE
jgi:periplasmic divalent cation tolerance protein